MVGLYGVNRLHILPLSQNNNAAFDHCLMSKAGRLTIHFTKKLTNQGWSGRKAEINNTYLNLLASG